MNSNKKSFNNLLNLDLKTSKDIKYNWHENPYGYYNLAKEMEIPYNLYEIFSTSLKDPNDEDYISRPNSAFINAKSRAKLNLPIIETIIMENGQIINWIQNNRDGFVVKKNLKKIGINDIINYFLSKIKNFSLDGQRPFENIEGSKILTDLQSFASNIIHKKGEADENFFKENHLDYIFIMEKIKFILIYYYSDKEPLLIDFINFYYLINELGGINSIKMIQNCINCKFKNSSLVTSNSLKPSFTKENLSFLYNNPNNKNSESELRKVIVKYSKQGELEPKNYFVFYEKPQISNLHNNEQTNNFGKFSSNKKIFINAELKNNLELTEYGMDSQKFKISEKSSKLKLNENNKIETDENHKSFESAFKYYLKKDSNIDPKFYHHMKKIEENLILQNSDLLIKTLSILTEKLIKYIERAKNIIVLNTYFNFVRISDPKSPGDDFYAFQKCLLLQGIDKNEPPVIEKRNILKLNMNNIISKRIPEDVGKFKYYEKFTKNNFCHGEFCHYVVPSFFKGIKEPQKRKYNFKIPKENKISTRDKNNELPKKIPLFEIKKVYDNPELANLVLKAYSIFPPSFNKEEIIDKLIKKRNKKDENQKERSKEINNEEENRKQINMIEDEYDSIIDSYEKISEKIQEYENEFKQEIIVYIPTPGKFLHVDYNDMYTDKGVCKKCYKIYTLILEFFGNIDECTAEFKNLIKAKKFLIKGENLRLNNYDDKSGNENNLIIQEELGKTNIKKFLAIKLIKLRMEELKKYDKKEKFHIVRNIITQKQELNKTFDYNIRINLRLLLSNLLAEKTNNQFFNLLFDEIISDEDAILKHLDLKKPKFNFQKTNLKDLRLQMGISSLNFNPNILSNKKSKQKNKKNSIIERMIQNEKELEKNQIVKNIRQQICQVDKNLFQEYNLLNNTFTEKDYNKILYGGNGKSKSKTRIQIIEEIFEYYRTPISTGVKNYSVCGKENKYINESIFSIGEEENERYNTLQNKNVAYLLKMHKIKNLARRKEGMLKKETKRLYKVNQIKSLEEIKKQKERQLELFLKFDTRKYRKKNKNSVLNKNREESSDDNQNSSFDLSFDYEEFDKRNRSSESNSEKWEKDKVIISSIFFNKKSNEFMESNSTPYFFLTTPFPKLRDSNSIFLINKNPLDILRKMDVEYFISLGNFKDAGYNKGNNIFNSMNVRFYSDDNFTSVPYEILDYNDSGDFEQNKRRNTFKNAYNNINLSHQKVEDKKKYIVFVLNDFFDTYMKYKNIFKSIIYELKGQYTNRNKNKHLTKNKNNLNLNLNEHNDVLLNKNQRTSNNSNNKRSSLFATKKTTLREKIPNIFDTKPNLNIKKEKTKEQIKKEKISELKFILFNLPGQSTTIFTKKYNQNNIYYSEFLDRFIYFLYKEKEFDLSYKIILLGFGNGGHIALTYTSLYEKYWNILDSVILFNSYCRNGTIINEAMLDILKTATREKNPKKIEAFIKQNVRNPKEFNLKTKKRKKYGGYGDEILDLQKNVKNQYLKNKRDSQSVYKLNNRIKTYYDNIENDENEDNNENENNMTIDGYKTVTRGYFYNIPINLKDISTKILCVHSNVDSFINIHNISPLFGNDIPSYTVTPLKILYQSYSNNKAKWNMNLNKLISVMGYDLSDFKKDENITRKLIIFDGSHDITYSSDENNNVIFNTLISYFK